MRYHRAREGRYIDLGGALIALSVVYALSRSTHRRVLPVC